MPLSEEDIKQVADAVTTQMDAKTRSFYVDREKHWKHHEFLDKLIGFFDKASDTALKTIVRMVVVALIGIFLLGIGMWIKSQI